MNDRVHPGDIVWIGPDTSLYHQPDVFDLIDDVVRLTDDWQVALVVGTYDDGWTFVLHCNSLVFVGTRCLMSINKVPSSIRDR